MKKKNNNKKENNIFLIVIALILIVVSILFGRNVFIKNKIKNDTLDYLKNKYNKEFKIEKLDKISAGTKPFFDFDSPEDHSGEKRYFYNVTSIEDGISFDARCLTIDGKEYFIDSYKHLSELYGLKNEIIKSIKDNIDTKNYDNNFVIMQDKSHLSYSSFTYHIVIQLNGNLNDLLNKEYVDKLYMIKKEIFDDLLPNDYDKYYMNSNTSEEYEYYYVNLDLLIKYNSDIRVRMGYDGVAINDNDESVGGFEAYTYLNQLKED